MINRNHWTQWSDDEGDTRECGPLTAEQADKLAKETSGWVVSFDDCGKQVTVANYYPAND